MKKSATILFIIVALLISGLVISNNLANNQTTEKSEGDAKDTQIDPFIKAKALKEEYFTYEEVINQLKVLYPGKDLLSEYEIKQIFPELWIGQSIACSGTEAAMFFGNPNNAFSDNKDLNVNGQLSISEDSVAVKILNPDSISFLTAVSVESGETVGTNWKIIRNDDAVLIAQYDSSFGVDTLAVSKKTGLGVWQSVDGGIPPNFEVPHAQSIYLRCILPIISG